MKITVSQLRRIIKEEVQRSLRESAPPQQDLDILKGLTEGSTCFIYKDGKKFTIKRTGDAAYTVTDPSGKVTEINHFMPGPMGQHIAYTNLLKFLYGTS